MFSKKMMVIAAVCVLIAINLIALFVSARYVTPSSGTWSFGLRFISPPQQAVAVIIRSVKTIWTHYFYLVSTESENDRLRKLLADASRNDVQCMEAEQANSRFQKLLDFKNSDSVRSVAAEVIGKDPSQWSKTIIIDKGLSEGVNRGLAVVVPNGVVGQVVDAANHYAKVLLVIDSNCAVDALVQQTRAHGIVKGDSESGCLLKYVSRKEAVNIGDDVVSSGLDGVFMKGLQIGKVSAIVRDRSGIFQDITVTPFVDFEKIEEVLVLLTPPPSASTINR